jgi:hypothetical protein
MKRFFFLIITAFFSSSAVAIPSLASDNNTSYTYERKKPANQGIEISNGWLVLGDIRAGWVQYDYNNPPQGIDQDGNIIPTNPDINKGHVDSKGIYIIPKLSLMSPKFHNFSTKVTGVFATDFGLNDEKYEQRNFIFDPHERKSFALLQEAYISYEDANHKALIGREELATPMIDKDDWYMLADTFELAYYAYTGLQYTTIGGGYFYKMAGVWDSGANGTEFHTMSDASFVSSEDKANANGKGVITATLLYNDTKHHNLQIWNYYATDLYNTFFAQYDWSDTLHTLSYDFGLQFIDFQEVGALKAHDFTEINYSLYSARFDGTFQNGLSFATGIAKYTDGPGQGATLGAWGGYPYFANGMIFHFFEAGSLCNALSYKIQGGYDLQKLGIAHTTIAYRYTYYELDATYSLSTTGLPQETMVLNGVRLQYSAKNGAYFTGTYEHVDLDHEPNTFSIRLIGGVRF